MERLKANTPGREAIISQKGETPHQGELGGASGEKLYRCENSTPAYSPRQPKLHPMARRGLENLQDELRYLPASLTTTSTMAAIAHILKNH